MRASIATLAATSLLVTSAAGLTLVKRDDPKAVHIAFRREEPSPEYKERLRLRRRGKLTKRQKAVSETLDNFQGGSLYFANVTLGTPPQRLRFHLDTGSSDLWANSPDSPFCQQPDQQIINEGAVPCSVSGTYDSGASSTFREINNDFFIQYADTTGASGIYASDVLNIGGATLNNLQFGVGLQSNSSEGVMGIGYPSLEVAVQNNGQRAYPNIPQAMTSQGLINTPAYSLWLDSLDSSTGNILFGAVDTTKFTGSLTTLPIIRESGQYVEMVIGLNSVSVTKNGKDTTVDSQAIPVLLDSGSTLTYLPTDVAKAIYNAVGATYHASQGVATCKCTLGRDTSESLSFDFGGQKITVALSQLVLQEGNACLFGIMPSNTAPFTLGDTFIRNAYIVYDLNANTISLAQTNFDPQGQGNIMEITNGTSGVPSAVAAANPPSITLDGRGQRYNGGAPTNIGDLDNAAARPTAPPAAALGMAAAGAGMLLAAM